MLTQMEKEQFLEENRDKLVTLLKKAFPKLNADMEGNDLEDVIHGAVYAALFREFGTAAEMMSYLQEKATFLAINLFDQQIERKRIREGLPRRRRERDPMRKIDWKIDLERAIAQSTHSQRMQAGLWHCLYEGFTQDEVADMLGCDQSTVARAISSVNHIMKQKGY